MGKHGGEGADVACRLGHLAAAQQTFRVDSKSEAMRVQSLPEEPSDNLVDSSDESLPLTPFLPPSLPPLPHVPDMFPAHPGRAEIVLACSQKTEE